MRGALCYITVVLVIVSAPAYGALRIDPSLVEVPIGRHVEYVEDAAGVLTFDQVLNSSGVCWTRSERNSLGFGFTRSAYWLRFTIENPAGRDLSYYLEEAWPLIDEIDFYAPDGDAGYRRVSTGDYRPFASRPLEYRTFVFPFTQKAESSSTYYMRFRTTSSMSLPLTLWGPDTFKHRALLEERIMLLFYGMMLVMIIYNLFVYAAIRQRSYLYYVLFIASFMCFIMTQQGTAFQYLWPGYPWFANVCIPLALALVILFAYYFTRNFLPMSLNIADIRLVDRSFFVITIIGIGISLFALHHDTYFVAMEGTALLALLSIAGAVYITIRFSFKRVRAAYFYLSGWIVFFAGSCLYIARIFSFLPPNFMSSWSMLFGVLFMMVVLSIAQADMMNTMRKDLAALSSGLEVKVRERTEELEAAMEELEAINFRLHETNDKLETANMIADLDIRMAANLQKSLLPRAMEKFDDWDLACAYLPMKGVSGDFYDVYHNGGTLLGVALFDVSGHGIASGLITILAKSILYRHFTRMHDRRLDSIMKRFNEELVTEIKEIDNYLTGILISVSDNAVEYVNAGHTDLLMRDGATGRIRRERSESVTSHSSLLGITGIENRFDVLRFSMQAGDMLLLFSDGITECRNGEREAFGEERLARAFGQAPRDSAQAALDHIMERAAAFTGGVPFHDDVTLIAVMKCAR